MRMIVTQPPYIIGEAGACHNGEFDTAVDLIEIASESGCHAVKFQLYDAFRMASRRNAMSALDMYSKYQLPLHWLPKLREETEKWSLDLILSVYDKIDLIEALPFADALKVSSFESRDMALLAAASEQDRNLFVSTGMCDHADMARLWRFQKLAPCQVALLHCISSYPAPVHDLNLSAIRLHDMDGYSDHSGNRVAGGIAVAYGAKILEVHIRDTDTPEENPDFKHALGPSALAAYVTAAIDAQLMGGHGRREVMPSEMGNLKYRVKG